MILLVMFIQTQVYREVTNLFVLTGKNKDEPAIVEKKRRDPWSKTLNWYFFAAANYFLYGESMVYYFKVGAAARIYTAVMLTDTFVACRLRGRPFPSLRQ